MSTTARFAGFLAALAAVFALALGVGSTLGPTEEPKAVGHDTHAGDPDPDSREAAPTEGTLFQGA